MLDQSPARRSLRRHLLALVLLALAAFVGTSLVSYDPADPPSRLVYPPREVTGNACGPVGAWVAHGAIELLGLGAHYAAFSLAAAALWLLASRPIVDPTMRIVGWTVSLVGLATLFTLAAPGLSPGPVVGSGGYVGALGRSLLEMHFASLGAYLLVTCATLAGLLLATDYALPRLAYAVVGRPALAAASRVAARRHHVAQQLQSGAVSGTSPAALRPAADSEEEDEAEEDEDELADGDVPIRTAAAARSGDEEDEEEDEEEEDDDDEEDELEAEVDENDHESADAAPATGRSLTGGVTSRLRDVLRIRPPRPTEREAVLEELEAASCADDAGDYELPPVDLLLEGEPICFEEHKKDVRRKARVLERTFANFGLNVKVVAIETGPVIAQFEVELEAGLRLSRITSLSDDLAIALRVPSVRIVAPIPGKNTVGIEVPNAERQLVRLREVIEETNGRAAKMRIPIFLGKDVSGRPMTIDLTTLPHLLIAGRTGTGKSVCLNTLIMSILMTRRPDEVRLLLIDPKMVELSCYMKLPHLMHPVVTDMKKAEAILGWAVDKMEERYALLARAGVRHISAYNQLGEEELLERLRPENEEEAAAFPRHLPYIVIVADEMADLMMTAAKEVETHIIRLAQKSRAVGIHLVLATQKPTVDVITGLIKSNLPARIAFQVASRTDSRVVLDEMGADKLLGNGDLLFLWPGTSTLLRGQGAYVGDDEINEVVDYVGQTEQQFVHELVALPAAGSEPAGLNKDRDDLYEAAVDIVIREGRGSVSLLQRALGIGYGRAARLIDYMAEDGLVGEYNGSQAREVLITIEQWEAMSRSGAAVTPGTAPALALAPPKPVAAADRKAGGSRGAELRVAGGGNHQGGAGVARPTRRGDVAGRDEDDVDEEPPFDVDDEAADADYADTKYDETEYDGETDDDTPDSDAYDEVDDEEADDETDEEYDEEEEVEEYDGDDAFEDDEEEDDSESYEEDDDEEVDEEEYDTEEYDEEDAESYDDLAATTDGQAADALTDEEEAYDEEYDEELADQYEDEGEDEVEDEDEDEVEVEEEAIHDAEVLDDPQQHDADSTDAGADDVERRVKQLFRAAADDSTDEPPWQWDDEDDDSAAADIAASSAFKPAAVKPAAVKPPVRAADRKTPRTARSKQSRTANVHGTSRHGGAGAANAARTRRRAPR